MATTSSRNSPPADKSAVPTDPKAARDESWAAITAAEERKTAAAAAVGKLLTAAREGKPITAPGLASARAELDLAEQVLGGLVERFELAEAKRRQALFAEAVDGCAALADAEHELVAQAKAAVRQVQSDLAAAIEGNGARWAGLDAQARNNFTPDPRDVAQLAAVQAEQDEHVAANGRQESGLSRLIADLRSTRMVLDRRTLAGPVRVETVAGELREAILDRPWPLSSWASEAAPGEPEAAPGEPDAAPPSEREPDVPKYVLAPRLPNFASGAFA